MTTEELIEKMLARIKKLEQNVKDLNELIIKQTEINQRVAELLKAYL